MSHISTGYLLGSWIAGILVVICILTCIGAAWYQASGESSLDGGLFLAWGTGVTAVFAVVIYVVTTWPTFDMQYHTYRKVGGTISTIQARGLATDGGTTFNYAVQFGTDQTYRCDDTRCAVLKPGDVLHLWCIREYQWNATPGYSCNFADSRRAGLS